MQNELLWLESRGQKNP